MITNHPIMKQSGTLVTICLWLICPGIGESTDGPSPDSSLSQPAHSLTGKDAARSPPLRFGFCNALPFPCYFWPRPPFQTQSQCPEDAWRMQEVDEKWPRHTCTTCCPIPAESHPPIMQVEVCGSPLWLYLLSLYHWERSRPGHS